MSKIRILSLDGGGIRGAFTAKILAELEKRIVAAGGPTQLNQVFHMIAGTSTGGIIATGLCKPGTPKTAAELMELYVSNGGSIFPEGSRFTTLKNKVTATVAESMRAYKDLSIFAPITAYNNAKHILGDCNDIYNALENPLYPTLALEEQLKKTLGNALLSQVDNCELLVTSYDMISKDPVLFKSWKARNGEADSDFRLWQVARATSAAPVYFPPADVSSIPTGISSAKRFMLVDGGVYANNPSMCALAAARKLHPDLSLEDFTVVSIGTGQLPKTAGVDPACQWGALAWLPQLLSVFMDGASDTIDYQVNELLDKCYLRLQASLDEVPSIDPEMDDSQKPNIDALLALADVVIERLDDRLTALAKDLAQPRQDIPKAA